MVRELMFNPVHIIAECFVLVVGLDAGVEVPSFDEFIGRFGEQSSAKIDFAERVRLHHLGFSGLRVQQLQRGQIGVLVGFHIEALVSRLKLQRIT